MKSVLLKYLLFISFAFPLNAQSSALRVFFKDKGVLNENLLSCFNDESVKRRKNAGISWSIDDFPVCNNYLNKVSAIADSVVCISKWFNFITVYVHSENQTTAIQSLSFVDHIEKLKEYTSSELWLTELNHRNNLPDDTSLLRIQTTHMKQNLFGQNGIDGTGIRVAVFDVGFPGFKTHPAFSQLIKEGRLLASRDFVRHNSNVFHGHKHGTMTSACIAGKLDSVSLGCATGAGLLLARTEVNWAEPFREEENWLMAAEWADEQGAHIISSSLGYSHHRYFYNQLDGRHSMVAKAAAKAVSKGILVVNSVGNEYERKWRFLITPADNDSVLAVGGISPVTGYHIDFSSAGPNASLKIKPNVCALGHVFTATPGAYNEADGTSFSCPLISGFAACLLQLKPELIGHPVETMRLIEQSGHLYPYFDYVHGFGVPQSSYFFDKNKSEIKPTFTFTEDSEKVTIYLDTNAMKQAMPYPSWSDVFYYRIENENQVAQEYAVILVYESEVLKIRKEFYTENQKLVLHYKGYTWSYSFSPKNTE